MNINDLAKLLNGRNITINISTGNSRQNNYNGVALINHAASSSQQVARPRWEYRCERCGYTSHERHEFIDQEGGYGHHSYLCKPCNRKKLLAARQERASSVIVEPEPEPEQIEAPRHDPQVIIVDTKRLAFEQRYREMQEAHAAHVAAEFEFIEHQRASGAYRTDRMDSRQEIDTDQYRVVKPLPANLHTHTPAPTEIDHARRLREEREWMQNLID